MIEQSTLPTLNAFLNGTSAVLLVVGFHAIKVRKDERLHKRFMVAASICSALFLTSYLTYHAMFGSKGYPGEGTIRSIYLVILATHTVLAAVNAPMIVATLIFGLRDQRERHRRLAKWTFPIWLYVSITGIVVYLMLYVWV